MARPGGWQAKTFGTDGFCAPSVAELRHAGDAHGRQPGGRAGRAEPVLRHDRRADRQGQDVLLRDRRLHAAGSDDVPVEHAAGVSAAGRRPPRLRGQLPSGAVQRPARPQDHAEPDADGPHERRSLLRHQSERRRRRHQRAQRRPQVHARLGDRERQRHVGAEPEPSQRGAHRISQRRSGHAVGGAERCRPRTRAPDRCRSPSASRASRTCTAARRSSRTRCRGRAAKHTLRLGTSIARHTSGGTGSEPGTAVARHLHVPQHDDDAVRSADAGGRAELHAADQLRHQQLRAAAVAVRRVRAGQHPREQRPDDRRRASLRPSVVVATRRATSRRASASAGIPTAMRARRFAAATACTTRS